MPEYHARNGADKPLPHDLQAELDLLGSVLLDPACLGSCRQVVAPCSFFDDLNRAIFSTICELADAGSGIDVDLLAGRLKADGHGDDAIARLFQAAEAVPTAANALDYARTVARKAQQRRLFLAAREAARVALDDRLAARDPEALRKKFRDALAAAAAAPQQGDGESRLVLPVTRRLSEIEPEAIRWLWPGHIALGKLTLLVGDPGLGKSLATLDMAARVTLGSPWPDNQDARAPRGSVVLVGCEDDLADTVRPRLDAAGADVSKVIMLDGTRLATAPDALPNPVDLERDLATIEEVIRAAGDCRLLIVDPVTAFLGQNCDSHKNADVRRLLGPLAALAARQGPAVLLVSHLNKAAGGPAIYRTMGSLAFGAAARTVLGVSKCKDDNRRRLLVPIKNNIAADVGGLAFRTQSDGPDAPPYVAWEPDPIHVSADEALSAEPRRRGPEADAQRDAESFLRRALAAGPMPSKELDERAEAEGISERTLKRARKAVGVEPFKGPTGWFVRLPSGEPGPLGTLDPGHQQLGPLGTLEDSPGNNGDFEPPETQGGQECQVPCVLGDDDWGEV